MKSSRDLAAQGQQTYYCFKTLLHGQQNRGSYFPFPARTYNRIEDLSLQIVLVPCTTSHSALCQSSSVRRCLHSYCKLYVDRHYQVNVNAPITLDVIASVHQAHLGCSFLLAFTLTFGHAYVHALIAPHVTPSHPRRGHLLCTH